MSYHVPYDLWYKYNRRKPTREFRSRSFGTSFTAQQQRERALAVSVRVFLCRDMATQRSDRTPGNRGAYERARLKILKTQTHCGICGKPVDFSYKAPHPLSPTVDHIIPVSLGGHPSDPDNLQLAHRCCNREKSNKMQAPIEIEEESTIDNRDLPLSLDWKTYKSET